MSSLTYVTACSTSTSLPTDVPTLQALLTGERARYEELRAKSVEMVLEFQPYISGPAIPVPPGSSVRQMLWDQACTSDRLTTRTWSKVWMDNIIENVKRFDADNNMVDKEYGKHAYHPAIIVATGPSLKKNIDDLGSCPEEIPVLACLHSYAMMIDHNIKASYVTLDAQKIVIDEMTQGGTKSADYYWDSTKDHTLYAGLVSPPELIEKWKGKVLWYNAMIPDHWYMSELPKQTKNRWIYSVGGTTYGAVFYHAAYMWGCNPIACVGADFCFDYTRKFHPFDSPYDAKFAGVVPCTDVFGNRVWAWPSYQNFKAWFEFQAMGGQGDHNLQIINCTEGGTLGAYPQGNIIAIKQMRLRNFIDSYTRWGKLKKTVDDATARGEYTTAC